MRADVAWSWGTSYPGRSKIRCILQRALNVCQSFANESSFEYSMEKSQVVIFGGDYSFNAPAFTLMGQTMESVDRYKYLASGMRY